MMRVVDSEYFSGIESIEHFCKRLGAIYVLLCTILGVLLAPLPVSARSAVSTELHRKSIGFVAEACREANLGNLDSALAMTNKAVESDPECACAYAFRGEVLCGKGLFPQAKVNFEKALSISPKNESILVAQGQHYYSKLHNVAGAIRAYTQALTFDPNYTDALVLRGWCFSELGENKKAYADFDKAIQIDPKNAWAFNSRGLLGERLGGSDSSIQDLTQAVQLRSQNAYYHANQAYAEFCRGRLDEAKHDIGDAIQLDSNNAWFHEVLAQILNKQGNFAAALAALDTAKNLSGSDRFELRAEIEMDKEDYSVALSVLSKAIDKSSKYQDVIAFYKAQRGKCFMKLGLWNEALAEFDSINDAQYAFFMYELRAEALSHFGHYDLAAKEYTKALRQTLRRIDCSNPWRSHLFLERAKIREKSGKFCLALQDVIQAQREDVGNYEVYSGWCELFLAFITSKAGVSLIASELTCSMLLRNLFGYLLRTRRMRRLF